MCPRIEVRRPVAPGIAHGSHLGARLQSIVLYIKVSRIINKCVMILTKLVER